MTVKGPLPSLRSLEYEGAKAGPVNCQGLTQLGVSSRWGTAGHLTRLSLAPGFGEVPLVGPALLNVGFQDSDPQG